MPAAPTSLKQLAPSTCEAFGLTGHTLVPRRLQLAEHGIRRLARVAGKDSGDRDAPAVEKFFLDCKRGRSHCRHPSLCRHRGSDGATRLPNDFNGARRTAGEALGHAPEQQTIETLADRASRSRWCRLATPPRCEGSRPAGSPPLHTSSRRSPPRPVSGCVCDQGVRAFAKLFVGRKHALRGLSTRANVTDTGASCGHSHQWATRTVVPRGNPSRTASTAACAQGE